MIELPLSYNQRTRVATFYGADKWWRPPLAFALRWQGDPDLPLLRRALELVVRRHVSLRTYFPEPDSPACCVPAGDAEVSFLAADLRDLPASAQGAERESRLADLQAPFDLSRPLLIRASLLHSADWATLAFAADHTIFDGVSQSVFLSDFSHVYTALANGAEVRELEGVVSDYSHFAVAERDWIDTAPGAAAWEYWRQPWETYGPFPGMPFTRVPEAATHVWQRTLTKSEYSALRGRAREFRVSPFMLTVSAMNWTLRERFGVDAAAMIVMNSRRQSAESLRGVGNYATKLLLAADLRGSGTFSDCVSAVRTRVAEAIVHGMMPYDLLLAKLRPDKAGMRPDSPYLAFDMPRADETYRLGDHTAEVTSLATGDVYEGMSPALFVSIETAPDGGATMVAGHHHARFDAAEVDTFLEHTHARMVS